MNTFDNDVQRLQYGNESIATPPMGVCKCEEVINIGFRPLPGEMQTNQVGFRTSCPTCHCSCGNRQQFAPPVPDHQAVTGNHFQSGYGGGHLENYEPKSGNHRDDVVNLCPYPADGPVQGNNQYPGQTGPTGMIPPFESGVGSGAVSYGQSGSVTSTKPEFAPDGVRLLHYSGS